MVAPPPPAIVAPKPDNHCLTFDNAYAAAPLMVVRPDVAGRVNLRSEARSCTPGAACGFVNKAYILPGDTVLASGPLNGFRCVYVGARGKLSAGFVPEAALKPSSEDAAPASAQFLRGRWRDADDELEFKWTGRGLNVVGQAFWPGRGRAYRPDGSLIDVHTGDVHGTVRIDGARFDAGDDGDCHVWGWRRGPYLIVQDNGGCGGMNVRFDGVYVKADRAPRPGPAVR